MNWLAMALMMMAAAALGLASAAAGGGDLSNLPVYPRAKWTVAVYMNGDNELETSVTGGAYGASKAADSGTADALASNRRPGRYARSGGYEAPGDFHFELAAAGSNADVHVVALVDRVPGYSESCDNWTNTRLYYVEEGDYPDDGRGTWWANGSDTAAGSDERNMGDVATLDWFLATVQAHFPSDHLFLSMWDHNWGWHAGWFEVDETSGGEAVTTATMDYGLLATGLSPALAKVDVVGYDACVSAQIEVLHTWRGYATAFAGSQDYVGYGGIAYDAVIAALRADPGLSPDELAVAVARSLLTDPSDGCASAFTLAGGGFDALVAAVDALALSLVAHVDAVRDRLAGVRSRTPQTPVWVYDDFHRDLLGLAAEAEAEFSADFPDIAQAAANVTKAFGTPLLYNEVPKK